MRKRKERGFDKNGIVRMGITVLCLRSTELITRELGNDGPIKRF